MPHTRRFAIALALFALVAFAGCAEMPKTPAEQAEFNAVNDPFEPLNRRIFDVNDFLDRLLFRPLAELYRITVPPPLRDRVAGVVKNMGEPVVFANNLLQGELNEAGITFGRFVVNTTAGGAGMFDVATGLGLPRQQGDFGQTLHVWGFTSGPYIVLPFFGPSNLRDAIGLGVDSAMSPWKYLAAIDGDGTENRFMVSSFIGSGLVRREENIEAIDSLRKGSIDFYASLRSVYRQHRAKQLGESLPSAMPVYDDYDLETSHRPLVH